MKKMVQMFWALFLGVIVMLSGSSMASEATVIVPAEGTCSIIDLQLSLLIGVRRVDTCPCGDGIVVGGLLAFDLNGLVGDVVDLVGDVVDLVGDLVEGVLDLLGGATQVIIRKIETRHVPINTDAAGAKVAFKLCGLAKANLFLQYREHGHSTWITIWTSAQLNLLGHPLNAFIDVEVALPVGIHTDCQFRLLQILPKPLLGIDLDLSLNLWVVADLHICVGVPSVPPPLHCEPPGVVPNAMINVDASIASLGIVWDANVCGVAGTPKDITFDVQGAVTNLVSLEVSVDIKHFWVGDLVMTLISPGGIASHQLFMRPGVTSSNNQGHGAFFDGRYIFNDCGQLDLNSICDVAPDHVGRVVQGGMYRTCAADGSLTVMMDVFTGLSVDQINGVWTLRIEDYCRNYAGIVFGAHLRVCLA